MTQIISFSKLLCLTVLSVFFILPIYGQTVFLNSGWQFKLDKNPDSEWQTVNIPHTWNADDAFDDERGYYRGNGVCQKQVYVSEEFKELIHYLRFKGVNQATNVYVNGQKIGNHKGGYTAFTFGITPYLKYDAYNLIDVQVDNTHNENITPLGAGFTFWIGIYRDVELTSKPKQHLFFSDYATEGFYIDYPKVSEESASLQATVLIDNFSSEKLTNNLILIFKDAQGKVIFTEKEKLRLNQDSSEEIIIKFPELSNLRLWSPDNPYLYSLDIKLVDKTGQLLDHKQHSVGFRWVSLNADEGFYLNGNPIKLIGVNRHQDFKGYGNAVPLALQKKDIHLIKQMGSNVIRFAHYPHFQELYKLYDELGFLVWTEIPIVDGVTNKEAFFETAKDLQMEHIKQYYNFPSVVMSGYMNEVAIGLVFDREESKAEKEKRKAYTYQLAKELEDLSREYAPGRITVMALHKNEIYNETGIADLSMLVGWNLYLGWYRGKMEDLGGFSDEQHERYPNRPIMISEYGPGADVRIFAEDPIKYDYSQQYQLKLHKSYYEQVMQRDFVIGMTAWNFADFGSEFRGESIPHVNQKGLVQYDREQKQVYYWYQSVLKNDEPNLHIADYQNEITLLATNSYKIVVFSNQLSAKLYLNGKFSETLNFESGVASVNLNLKNGNNKIRVGSDNTSDAIELKVKKLENLNTENFDYLAISTGTHVNFYDEELDITFLADCDYTKNLHGYEENSGKCEKKLIRNNIKNSNREAVYQIMLMDCDRYKVDIPDGNYKVTLFFVEPKIRSTQDLIYNL